MNPVACMNERILPLVGSDEKPKKGELKKLREAICDLQEWLQRGGCVDGLDVIHWNLWPDWLRGSTGMWDIVAELNNTIRASQRK